MKQFLLICFTIFIIFSSLAYPASGKIAGIIKDAKTNEPLIGANVLIQGTTMGAASGLNGYYVILNVPPGTYTLKVSMIGFAQVTIEDVRVNIDQTTSIDVALNQESIQTQEVVVIARSPIVQRDVSSSRANISVAEIENLPVATVQNVIALQAGILSGSSGPIIRGGGADQTAFVLDGITLRDERDNTPYTGISVTSIQELQVQTGGFSAEYGNIRSGLINVVTKEGNKERYSLSFFGRYSPPANKYFGDAPNSKDSYWIRSYVDNAVAWTGTKNGEWDQYTQNQYQEFRGWNKVAEELANDGNPNNDLTPLAAQQLFLWQHRRVMDIQKPDYDIDMTFTGPFPYISKYLGNLRFAASYRKSRNMYIIPLSDQDYRDVNYQIKLTADLSSSMKLSVDGLLATQKGTNSSRSGGPGLFNSASSIVDNLDFRSGASYLDARVFATDYWAPSVINRSSIGAKFTHVLSPTTFYEVYVNRVSSDYSTNPGTNRDSSKIYGFGNAYFDEAPFGYPLYPSGSGIGSSMNMGLGFSNSRDSSKLTTFTLKFDLASQFNQYNYIKAGAEIVYTDNNVNYALIEPSLPSNNTRSVWHTFPIRGALYLEDKLEFEGMIANLGLRLEYLDPGGKWYQFDPYNNALSGAESKYIDSLLPKVSVDKQLYISPRLGVAFPITVDSKLYFNYGHFRSMPIPEQLYLIRRSQVNNQVTRIADPNNPIPLTIMYELGYEHNLFDKFLLRIAGYYKDAKDEPRLVTYTSRNSAVNYDIPEPNRYADTRGFEITINKNRGEWVRGFINYTYEVSSYGYFGLPNNSQNPATQREFERNTRAFDQIKPVPRPYARANIDLFTPMDFGPELGGIKIFEDWRLNILATWRSGVYFAWTGPGGVKAGVSNNIQWNDFYNVDLRFSKAVDLGPVNLELFMDMTNALNFKRMDYKAGFVDANDYDKYMQSLHLPDDIVGQYNYGNIPGNDKPGDIRTGPYIPWNDNASESQKEEWRKNKSYIDMPNLYYAAFINPRDVFWGIKLSMSLY